MTKTERITNIEDKIAQLENQRRQLLQKQKADEQKARTRRLCSRHGLFEKMLPDTISLTDEQFTAFLEKTVCNNYGRRILAGIVTPQTAPAPSGSDGGERKEG